MNQEHFTALANTLRSAKPCKDTDDAYFWQWEFDCRRIASMCEKHNDKFSYKKFLKACGID